MFLVINSWFHVKILLIPHLVHIHIKKVLSIQFKEKREKLLIADEIQ